MKKFSPQNIYKTKFIKILLSAVVMLGVMAIIFIFSGQTGDSSSKASNSFGQFILDILHIEVPEGTSPSEVPILGDFNIRNCAHIFLYVLLGLTSFLFASALFGLYKNPVKAQSLWIALGAAAISFLYACFDEWHQSFVDGRTSSFRDVGIDAVGFMSMIAICLAVSLVIQLVKKRKKSV